MPTVAITTKGGGTAGEIALSERIFGAPRNTALMHQAVRMELQNSRQDTKNTLRRGEILGGGRKPWRQKGTGRARQGSIVAPHWRHGGVAHGPHPRDLGHDMPKKMRRQAIRAALSAKLADNELIVIDQLPLDGAISTKAAAGFLTEIGVTRKALVILDAASENVIKSLRNIENVTLRVAPAFSTRDVVDGGLVILTRAAIDKIESVLGDGTAAEADDDTPAAAAAGTEEETS
uniref:Large ribosomal subunit protein uL4 n=1 Tax=uncultured Armatimonadetes bacterium TaxID=157466 RepID=A0A6J4JCX8_9BACT|nr:LSU ribosomal protein L4p (L1e) [uncultured Armatimonadetes bacterium]